MSKQPVRGVEATALPEESDRRLPATESRFFRTPRGAARRSSSFLTAAARRLSRSSNGRSSVLREKNEKLEARLRELIDVARDNDVLAGKIHRLACRLMRARSAPTLIDALEASLREDFGASEWILLLALAGESGVRASIEPPSAHRRCRGARAENVRNAVRIGPPPLRSDSRQSARLSVRRRHDRDRLGRAGSARLAAVLGLLAIGSPDTERFHPTMSTDSLRASAIW